MQQCVSEWSNKKFAGQTKDITSYELSKPEFSGSADSAGVYTSSLFFTSAFKVIVGARSLWFRPHLSWV